MLLCVILALAEATLHPGGGNGLNDVRSKMYALKNRIAKETTDFDSAVDALDAPSKKAESFLDETPGMNSEFDLKQADEDSKEESKEMDAMAADLAKAEGKGRADEQKMHAKRMALLADLEARDKADNTDKELESSLLQETDNANTETRSGFLGINDLLTNLLTKVTGKKHEPLAPPPKMPAFKADEPSNALKRMQDRLLEQTQQFEVDAEKDSENFAKEIKSERGASSFIELNAPKEPLEKKLERDEKHLHDVMSNELKEYKLKTKDLIGVGNPPTRPEIERLERRAIMSAKHRGKEEPNNDDTTPVESSLLQTKEAPQSDEEKVGKELSSAQDAFDALTSSIKKDAKKEHHDLCCERNEKCCWFKETTPAPLSSYDPVVPRGQIETYEGTEAPPKDDESWVMPASSFAQVHEAHPFLQQHRDTATEEEFQKYLKEAKDNGDEPDDYASTDKKFAAEAHKVQEENEKFSEELDADDEKEKQKLDHMGIYGDEEESDDSSGPSSFMQVSEDPQDVAERVRDQLENADRSFKHRIRQYENAARPSSLLQFDDFHPGNADSDEDPNRKGMYAAEDKLYATEKADTEEDKKFGEQLQDLEASSFLETNDYSGDSTESMLASWRHAIDDEEHREHERTNALFKKLGMEPSSLLQTGEKPSEFGAAQHAQFSRDINKLEQDQGDKSQAASDDLASMDAALENMPQSLAEKARVKSSLIQKKDIPDDSIPNTFDPLVSDSSFDTITAPMIGVSDLDSADAANGPTGDLNTPLDDAIDPEENVEISTPVDNDSSVSTLPEFTPTSYMQVDSAANLRAHEHQ